MEWCCTCKGAWELVSHFVLHCCGFEKLGLPLCILGLLGWCLGQWRQSFIAGIEDFQGEVKERGWMWCICALSDYLGERECRSLADLKAPFPTLKGVAIVSLFFWLRHHFTHFFGDWLNHWISCFRWRWCVLLVTFVYFIWPCMVPSHWRLDNITAFSFEKIAALSGTWAVGLMGFLLAITGENSVGPGFSNRGDKEHVEERWYWRLLQGLFFTNGLMFLFWLNFCFIESQFSSSFEIEVIRWTYLLR